MNALQKAALNMQRAAGQHLGANIPIIKTVRAFRTAFDSFKGFNAQIIPAVGGQKTPRRGFAGDKRPSKTELCDATLTIAKPMRTFAADIGDNALPAKTNSLGNDTTKPAPIGKFTIRVHKAGFNDFEIFDFDMKLGEITTLNVELASS